MRAALAPKHLRQRIEHGINCQEIDDVLAGFSAVAILEVGGDSCAAGRFVGISEIRRWYERWFDRMSSIEYTVHETAAVRPWEFTRDNTIFVSFSVTETTTDGITARIEGVATYIITGGEISRLRIYQFDDSDEVRIWGHRSDVA